MKKLFLVFTLLFSIFFSKSVFAQDIKILINDEEVQSDVAPYIENGRTMVPIRVITEYLGGNVSFMEGDPYEFYGYQYLTVDSDNPGVYLTLTLIIDKNIALISEGTYRLETAPTIRNNRTFVPLRFLADYLNFDVVWDESTRTIAITPTEDEFNEDIYDYYDYNAEKALGNWFLNPTAENFERIFD